MATITWELIKSKPYQIINNIKFKHYRKQVKCGEQSLNQLPVKK